MVKQQLKLTEMDKETLFLLTFSAPNSVSVTVADSLQIWSVLYKTVSFLYQLTALGNLKELGYESISQLKHQDLTKFHRE